MIVAQNGFIGNAHISNLNKGIQKTFDLGATFQLNRKLYNGAATRKSIFFFHANIKTLIVYQENFMFTNIYVLVLKFIPIGKRNYIRNKNLFSKKALLWKSWHTFFRLGKQLNNSFILRCGHIHYLNSKYTITSSCTNSSWSLIIIGKSNCQND